MIATIILLPAIHYFRNSTGFQGQLFYSALFWHLLLISLLRWLLIAVHVLNRTGKKKNIPIL